MPRPSPRRALRLFACTALAVALAGVGVIVAQPGTPGAPMGDPAENNPLLAEPKTPEGQFDAVMLLAKIGRPKLAAEYLQKFANSVKGDDATLLKIYRKQGAPAFLRLEAIDETKVLAKQLLDRINAMLKKQQADPARINQLISLAIRGTAQQKQLALAELRNSGDVIYPTMIQRLGRPIVQNETDDLLALMLRLGNPVVPALHGVVKAPNDQANLKANALNLIGALGTQEDVRQLWFPAFSANQPDGIRTAARRAIAKLTGNKAERVDRVSPTGVAAQIRADALRHFRGDVKWKTNREGKVELWIWDNEVKTVRKIVLDPQAATISEGTKYAQQSLAMTPTSREAQAMYLGLALTNAQYSAGWGADLPTGPGTAYNLAVLSGQERVTDALKLSLREGNPAVAAATLRVLGQVGTKGLLESSESPVRSALNHPDSRVRYNAARSILQIDPPRAFSGIGRVVSVMSRALQAQDTAKVLTIHPDANKAATISGYFTTLGLDPISATTGQVGFRTATSRGDIGLIVISAGTVRWPLSQTLANLRADARTAAIPIVVFGRAELEIKLQRTIRRASPAIFVKEIPLASAMSKPVEQFLGTIRTPPLTAKQRADRASDAAFWLAYIASGRRTKMYDLKPAEEALIEASNDQGLMTTALTALAAVPTAKSQLRMQQIAVDLQTPTNLRGVAADQLAYHIRTYGLLLNAAQVEGIRTAWRSTQDGQLATSLAGVIGSLKPNAKLVGERMKKYPMKEPREPQPMP